jgi:hypothetical protein
VPEKDPVIELAMPSFLMPPLEIRHPERVPHDVMALIAAVTTRAWFPRRTIRLRALRNVFVSEAGLVIHPDLSLEPMSVREHGEAHIARARAAIAHGRAAGTIPSIENDVVLCQSFGAWNYGHWLIEMLPVAYAAAKHWPRPARYLVQAAEGHLRNVVHEAYELLGIHAHQRIESGPAPIFVERLVIVEGLTDHGSYIAPLVMECLDHLSAAIRPDPNRKLFVGRGSAPTRRLPCEPAIARRLMANGYVCLAPGTASFAAQIAAFRGAQRIVGVLGAALANLAFAPRGAEIIMLSPAMMPDTFFWFICGLRGIRLIDLRCRTAPTSIGNPEWDGPLDLGDQDEDELVAAATAPPVGAWSPEGLFDPLFYRSAYADSIPPDADPMEHFFKSGWRAGFDPSPHFSTRFYLGANPDIAASGANPLAHYIAHGRAEGRLPK